MKQKGELKYCGGQDDKMNRLKQTTITWVPQRSCSSTKMSLILPVTTSMGLSPLIRCTSPTLRLQYSRKGMVCSLQVLNLLRMVSRLSSSRPLLLPRSRSLFSRVSRVHSRQRRVLTTTSSPKIFFQASQFSALLGKPSMRQVLLLGPSLKMFLLMMSTSISLGASFPSARRALILAASSQSVLMNSLSRSPVEQWTNSYLFFMTSH